MRHVTTFLKPKKLFIVGLFAVLSASAYGQASLEDADTMYYFAKKCGGYAYSKTNNGWQAYSADAIYYQYNYMIDMTSLGSMPMYGTSKKYVSRKDLRKYLKKTRSKRLRNAVKQHWLTCN